MAYGPSHHLVIAIFIRCCCSGLKGRRATDSQGRLLQRVLTVLLVGAFVVALICRLIRWEKKDFDSAATSDVAELRAAYAL